jgi:hypothetical protein
MSSKTKLDIQRQIGKLKLHGNENKPHNDWGYYKRDQQTDHIGERPPFVINIALKEVTCDRRK